MKDFIKKYAIGFILGAIIFGPLSYVTAATIAARNITYNGANTNASLTNAQDAIEELYNRSEPITINFQMYCDTCNCSGYSFSSKTVNVGFTFNSIPTPQYDSWECGNCMSRRRLDFNGWYSEQNGGGIKLTETTIITPNFPRTFYAYYNTTGISSGACEG
jgi:hypothetical protein